MRIQALRAKGFRNLEGRYELAGPLSVIVGENNAGKSSLLDAIRIMTRNENGPRGQLWLEADDFSFDAAGQRLSDELELELEIADLSTAQQARLVTCQAPSLGVGFARLCLQAKLDERGRVATTWFGGDSKNPGVEEWARTAITYTYLPPLRDATSGLRPGRNNQLATLIAAHASGEKELFVEAMSKANAEVLRISSLQSARQEIQTRLQALTGGQSFTQKTDVAFSDPQFERVVGSLRALAGDQTPLELERNGLGYNNLLYMAVLLAAIQEEASDDVLRLLLVEEPEAHLHPQLQSLMLEALQNSAGPQSQVILSTHSPNFTSAAPLEALGVFVSGEGVRKYTTPKTYGLAETEARHLRRFLDATKADLFFARGVIMVEGLAEQLLIPALARRCGFSLSTHGVSVINIGGVAFAPFRNLFGTSKIQARCAVVSDSDRTSIITEETDEEPETKQAELSPRAEQLLSTQGENVRVFLADQTLEWDLAHQKTNRPALVRALAPIRPRLSKRLEEMTDDDDAWANELLRSVKDWKGVFAQHLADTLIENPSLEFTVPSYLVNAISWAVNQDAPGGQ